MLNRKQMWDRVIAHTDPWDIVVIGGGATGAGIAVDAASRGYHVLLLEQHDFGKGTSSRSTKLVHGGVRYLEQGNVSLVMEALHERGMLLQNAPHLVRDLPFIVPSYEWWESPFYGLGLKVYNLLAGKYRFGGTQLLSIEETLKHLPTIRRDGLRGGVVYHDGQFDDTRLLINLVATAAEQGGALLNYASVTGLLKGSDGLLNGVTLWDRETGTERSVQARVVINATGAFVDAVRRMSSSDVKPMVAPSQGVHLVFDKSFLPGDSAIMVPHTPDGRVMFAIPWHDHTVVGTTDVPLSAVTLEPQATDAEIDFILETAGRYLQKPPTRADILSVFAGIRPLVKMGDGKNTASLSRDHTIHIDHSGLITIVGGKWTTYRNMAEDCVNQAATLGGLDERPCRTRNLPIHGATPAGTETGSLAIYGSDAPHIRELIAQSPQLGEQLHSALPYTAAEVLWAARHEMARTVEDILARRTRALFLNSRAAIDMAPRVAALLASELGRDEAWQAEQVRAFKQTATHYLPKS